ncbi:MAG TPA: ribbon-helix-helix domain-containing protein [Candidatus Cybelea sp.]|nr:ribbon-helix-helix domain-containing protein [Candidatus Cybelea sp.]
MIARNVTVAGRRTSLRMEPEMWDALQEAAEREGLSLHEFCTTVARRRGPYSMTAAIRVHLLGYFRDAATEAGHRTAGHGKPRGKKSAG